MSMTRQVFEVCNRIDNGRTHQDILAHAMSEVGELAEEVMIAQGRSYKEAGKDGIIGEAVDVMLCMFDIIHRTNPSITEDEIMMIMNKKLLKWELTTDLVKV